MRSLLLALALSTLPFHAVAQLPSKDVAAPESWVKDDFIAYMHGVIYGDHELGVSGAAFRAAYPEFDTDRWTPFDEIERIARTHTEDGVIVMVEFEAPMRHTVEAVNILGWRPVRLEGSRRIVGREVHADSPEGVRYRRIAEEHGTENLVVFPLVDSEMRVDIEDWVDVVLGPLVDDIDVRIVAMGRYDGVWYGMMGGVNADLVPRTGVHNLTLNKFELMPPADVSDLAVELVRSTME
ncbi:MAG: hypothetical protein ACOC2Y_05765 [Spirochaetota bacterium]